MASIADEHLVEEPRGGRGFIPKNLVKGKLMNLRFFRIRSSALARRIIIFNLIALCVLLMGMLYLNQFKGGLLQEKQAAMQVDANLYASVLQSRMAQETTVDMLVGLSMAEGVNLRAFNLDSTSAGMASGNWDAITAGGSGISSWLGSVMGWVSGFGGKANSSAPANEEAMAQAMAQAALDGQELMRRASIQSGETILAVARPVVVDGKTLGAVVLTSQAGYLDSLLRGEQETVLRLFLLAVIVSVVLSLVLANAIANPINDLAAAAEAGTTKHGRASEPERVRIPDLTGRPDEIGHLSRAMRGMTEALYERIDTNEEFAADVAHEIKNPLASLRSAVETLRIIKKEESRIKLLDVIEHDVRRLDRLVSDISNASRLDAELVKEELEPFDLTLMLDRIVDFHAHEAGDKGVELIWSQPEKPIMYDGLEGRLAQVFVNLITNAVSFCGDGDAVRVWAREKDNRVLIVVEDTGPGIPNEALTKVFKRFYSERSAENFGNNSGLGLSISKQIVEAHKGVIWAENIRAKGASDDDAPLGARFVVGLPI